MLIEILLLAGAYLLGSIPTGLLLAKAAGVDIRTTGSGNIGATNVSRVGGKALGVVTLLLDIVKGFLPVFLARKAGLGADLLALMALAAVLGHVFTPWLKFQGGKGVATALGVILATDATLVALPMGVLILALWLTPHVSLGSILAAAMVPVTPILAIMAYAPMGASLVKDRGLVLPWLALAVLVIWKHRENIARLQAGTESKLWGAKQEDGHVQG